MEEDSAAPTAAPAPSPSTQDTRRWWQKKRFLLPLGLAIVAVLAFALSGGDPEADTASPQQTTDTPTETATEEPNEDVTTPAAEETTAEPEASPGEVYDEAFGVFEPISESGAGDSIITLPEAAAGLVTATHQGSANFAMSVLDSSNQPTGDLLVNTIGAYSGTTAYGLASFGEGVKLQVTADGSWSIEINPISSAPQLQAHSTGAGDVVLLFDGEASDWAVSHEGESNFVVNQVSSGPPNLAVNEIGSYSGTVPLVAGPSVIAVNADGTWSFQRQ